MDFPVKTIQQRLNELGFGPLAVDGIKGPRTSAAIRAFKRSIGFRDRDFVGELTWAALHADAPEAEFPWLAEGLKVLGLHERRNLSKLRLWLDAKYSWASPNEIAWCGSYVATCFLKFDPDMALPSNPLGAKNWAKFGIECSPQLGAVMVFHRGSPSDWRGHVAFYLGESDTAYYVLGGNQSDAVTKTWISKTRYMAARFPRGYAQTGSRIRLDSKGQPLSRNEA